MSISGLRVIGVDDQVEWEGVLSRSRTHDFYHLRSYHLLAEKRGEGKASLFVYQDGDRFVALPLLIRQIDAVSGLGSAGQGLYDATSVYGYAGPLASEAELPDAFLDEFRRALFSAFRRARVISVFSRLHPLIAQQRILSGLGECQVIGRTISMDLLLPSDVQFSRYRENHRRGTNRLRRMGATCQEDTEYRHLDEFVNAYTQTMRRANAAEGYFFEREYFRDLAGMAEVHLFNCTLDGEMLCSGLFTLCDGIVQYHLSGVRSEFQNLAPTKLMLDEARLWANEQKAWVLHLGGGLGSREDSLFHFKAGFSDRRHDFAVWRWIVDKDAYERLRGEKEAWNHLHGLRSASADYFPAYRSPTTTTAEAVGVVRRSDSVPDGQETESQR